MNSAPVGGYRVFPPANTDTCARCAYGTRFLQGVHGGLTASVAEIMPATSAPTKTHPLDFLAEVASRTRAAAPHRSVTAHRLGLIAAAGDTLVIATALLAAFWFRFRSGLPADHILFADYSGYLLIAGLSALTVLTCLGLYDRELLLHLRQTIHRVGKGWAIWTCGLLILSTLFRLESSVSRGFLACGSTFVGAGLLTWRALFYRVCQNENFAAQLRKRVLLLGWNKEAEKMAHVITNDSASPYSLVGFVPLSTQGPMPADVTCLGNSSELTEILKYSLIDTVILADHQVGCHEIIQLANVCERELVQFQLIPNYFEILLAGLHLQNFSGIPLLGVSKLRLNSMGARFLKRTCDIIGSLLGLILTAPIIAFFGLLVILESPGPIFYRQRRSGRNGTSFEMIKIRSMGLDAESGGTIGWSTKHDPRRLKIGSVMRRWNVDELPQFWNVLKGQMSLVGPRPERPELIAGFKHNIPHYNARHTVKPGMTGWAQINGLRGDTDLAERIRHDLYYIEHWSLWVDLQCLVFTFFARRNAY